MHLLYYVAATDELTLNIELRNGRPVRELLYALAYLLVCQYINILVILNSVELENLDYVVREATTGHFPRPLHKEHHVIVLNPLSELSVKGCLIEGALLWLRLEIRVALLAIIMIMVVVVSTCMEETS